MIAGAASSRSTILAATFILSSLGSIPSSHGAATCRRRWRQSKKPSWICSPGALLFDAAGQRAAGADAKALKTWARSLRAKNRRLEDKVAAALSDEWAALMETYPDTELATRYSKELGVVVERDKARFSAWYELFPRSCAAEPGRHGTFARLRAMSAANREDGLRRSLSSADPSDRRTHRERKKQRRPTPAPDDPGSPWAIGAAEGGHKAIHPELGTLEDFRPFDRQRRAALGIEIALDHRFSVLARPSLCQRTSRLVSHGVRTAPFSTPRIRRRNIRISIRSILNTSEWRELVAELKSIFDFWIDQGVRIFRVDNPHTKPFPFWEW